MSALFRLLNWGPLLALSTISVISISTIYCDLMWWPVDTTPGLLHFLLFLFIVSMVLTNYFTAALVGPGFVPLRWRPQKKQSEKFLQYCLICQGFKAPRSHHCRKCDRCVIKMDHHCPWIGTCSGHRNQTRFLLFLFWAPIGCCHAIVVLAASMYRALNIHYYVYHKIEAPIVHLGIWSFIGCMFAVGLSIGVVVAVGMLFVMELKSVLRNRTGIEDWITEKANTRLWHEMIDKGEVTEDEEDRYKNGKEMFRFPYDLGWKLNLIQVVNWEMRPRGDGIHWPVVEGCDQFSLTKEQLLQKAEKRQRTVVYHAVAKYSGSFFPISFGCAVLWGLPCSDEPRMALDVGDAIDATRWKRHWIYGAKVVGNEERVSSAGARSVVGPRGWFPRRCVKEKFDGNDNVDKKAQ